MWRTVLFTFSPTIWKFSALLPIRLCKMTSTHSLTGVTLTVSNSTQKKCKALNFGGHDESAQILLGAEYLPFVNQIEDLGSIVSSSLSWKPHVESKLLECNRIFGFLKHSIPFSVPSSRKFHLYKSLILPIFFYGAPAWSPSLTMLHQLDLFQYKVLRWITNCSSYVSGLQSLKMLPVCYCLIRDDIVFLWKL